MTDPGWRNYVRGQCACFHCVSDMFGAFSNMAGGYGFSVSVSGIHVRSSEACYQASRYPHLPEVQERILAERSPLLAKRVAHEQIGETRPDWEQVKFRIMRHVLALKFATHLDRLLPLLRESGDMPIVEVSTRDDLWGAKLQADDMLRGRNVLGRLLMAEREHLLGLTPGAPIDIPAPPIPGSLILGREVRDDQIAWPEPKVQQDLFSPDPGG